MVEGWWRRAACHDQDTDLFFTEDSETQRSVISTFCASCPVREQCLAEANERGETYGIWGGLTPNQRHRLRHGHSGRNSSVAHRVTKPCRICGRLTRGRTTPLADAPGTVVRGPHGLCTSCYWASMRVAS